MGGWRHRSAGGAQRGWGARVRACAGTGVAAVCVCANSGVAAVNHAAARRRARAALHTCWGGPAAGAARAVLALHPPHAGRAAARSPHQACHLITFARVGHCAARESRRGACGSARPAGGLRDGGVAAPGPGADWAQLAGAVNEAIAGLADCAICAGADGGGGEREWPEQGFNKLQARPAVPPHAFPPPPPPPLPPLLLPWGVHHARPRAPPSHSLMHVPEPV